MGYLSCLPAELTMKCHFSLFALQQLMCALLNLLLLSRERSGSSA